jgi:hypothetical protein
MFTNISSWQAKQSIPETAVTCAANAWKGEKTLTRTLATEELAVAWRQRTVSYFLFHQGIFYQKWYDCRPAPTPRLFPRWRFFYYYCIFTIYSRYLKRVISKRDGCEYHPSMVLWSLSNEILWPHSVESSSYFRLSEQVSDYLVVVLCSPIFVFIRVCSYDFCYIWYA